MIKFPLLKTEPWKDYCERRGTKPFLLIRMGLASQAQSISRNCLRAPVSPHPLIDTPDHASLAPSKRQGLCRRGQSSYMALISTITQLGHLTVNPRARFRLFGPEFPEPHFPS